MSSLNEIKKRIKTVESTSKITNAMQLVASAKLKKEKTLFEGQNTYSKNFYNVFSYISKRTDTKKYSTKRQQANKNIWIIFFSSMGLCGSFNMNLVKEIEKVIGKDDELYIIGRRGKGLLKSKNINNDIGLNLELDDKDINYDLCYVLAENILKKYLSDNKIKNINMIYTKFVNSLSFVPEQFNLLPLDEKLKTDRLDKPHAGGEYNIEPNDENIIDTVITDYLATCLYGGILESKVCENASRRNAMDSATKNANELIKSYKLEFNRKRQTDITQEITEIVSGSNLGE